MSTPAASTPKAPTPKAKLISSKGDSSHPLAECPASHSDKGKGPKRAKPDSRSPSHRLILIEGRILLILSPSRGSKVFVPNWKVTTGDSISDPRVAFQVASRSILPTDAGLHLGKDSKTLDL